ncbi:glycosyltransferase family 2 protein [Xylocopilactobacillus apicola]|uniref:Glycosyltransferase 2-like domain-containing protein n=1 Tax=Xylocopilactobacillus apicola TaxID=2932184 RepID=A0AAU9D9Y9_9LACO|nr:glycosyltransferase [Xylocopilactobacillus apicola]BDR59246.1 hypothetical protein XA3_16870 [Xylocopilactobacillus apicola]
MEQKLISVIMTTYNERIEELNEAINSILDQTYPNFELIIILDNPENLELKKTINALAEVDQRIRFFVNEKNLGLAPSLNKAIGLTQGEFIARMDADDISFSDRLAVELNLIEEHQYDVVTSSATFIDEEGKIIGSHDPILRLPEHIAKLLPYGSNLVHPSAFFRGSVLREFGYHPYPTAEDYDLWLRLAAHQKRIAGVSSELIKYRIRKNSMTQSNKFQMFLTAQYLRSKFRAGTLDYFDEDDYKNFLNKYGYNPEKKAEFSRVVNGFSEALGNLRRFKFSGVKALMPLLEDKIYRDYFRNSYQYKKKYRKLITLEQHLA